MGVNEKRVCPSPHFSIAGKIRVTLLVYPSGIGRGQGTHMSVCLRLTEVVTQEENILLKYNLSVTAVGKHASSTPKTMELCFYKVGANHSPIHFALYSLPCTSSSPLPSPGEVLRSEELFLKIEEANSLLVNDSLTLELKLLEHQHSRPQKPAITTLLSQFPF